MQRRNFLAGAALLPVVARAQQRFLTITSWGGAYQEAQRDAYFRPWMARSGTRLLEEVWDGGIQILRDRLAAGTNTWDLVQVESEELALGAREGLFEPIEPEAVGGEGNYLPGTLSPFGVGAITYAFILAHDRNRLPAGPAGWADFFDLARFPGRRALRRGPKVTLEIALLADGLAPAEVYPALATPAGLARAFARLERIRPEIVWWERGSEPPQWLASGEVAMAAAYNGRIAAANANEGRNFGMVWQGNLQTMDSWVIMKGSPNKALALDFLRFAGEQRVQAGLAGRIPYGLTAAGAERLLSPDALNALPSAHRASALPIDAGFWLAHVDRLEPRFEAWLKG